MHFPLVHNTTAARLDGSGLVHGHHPAQAAVADWAEPLQGLFGTDINLREAGTDLLAVSVTPSILQVCLASTAMLRCLLHTGIAQHSALVLGSPCAYYKKGAVKLRCSMLDMVLQAAKGRLAREQVRVPQDALRWLAMQPAVHWLAPWTPVRLHNWQGTAISQSAAAAPDAPVALTDDHGSHPVWAAGLTGQGQIIGAGDSGIGEQRLRSGAAAWVTASLRCYISWWFHTLFGR